jgi:hypothetical protein
VCVTSLEDQVECKQADNNFVENSKALLIIAPHRFFFFFFRILNYPILVYYRYSQCVFKGFGIYLMEFGRKKNWGTQKKEYNVVAFLEFFFLK